jgi:Na+-transporting methylmalonyl-CoA/oxaloacetate decarboxylase gamma subunit
MSLLSNSGHGWHNVINANGIVITVVGMLLVYFSLSVISLIIKFTPYLLIIIDKYFPEEEEEIYSKTSVKKVSETEIVAAISTALYNSMESSKK